MYEKVQQKPFIVDHVLKKFPNNSSLKHYSEFRVTVVDLTTHFILTIIPYKFTDNSIVYEKEKGRTVFFSYKLVDEDVSNLAVILDKIGRNEIKPTYTHLTVGKNIDSLRKKEVDKLLNFKKDRVKQLKEQHKETLITEEKQVEETTKKGSYTPQHKGFLDGAYNYFLEAICSPKRLDVQRDYRLIETDPRVLDNPLYFYMHNILKLYTVSMMVVSRHYVENLDNKYLSLEELINSEGNKAVPLVGVSVYYKAFQLPLVQTPPFYAISSVFKKEENGVISANTTYKVDFNKKILKKVGTLKCKDIKTFIDKDVLLKFINETVKPFEKGFEGVIRETLDGFSKEPEKESITMLFDNGNNYEEYQKNYLEKVEEKGYRTEEFYTHLEEYVNKLSSKELAEELWKFFLFMPSVYFVAYMELVRKGL